MTDENGKEISPSPEISALNKAWLISTVPDPKSCMKNIGYKITPAGRAYVEEHRNEEIRFWLPWAVTTLVAIASLVCAIIK